jgi:hypothetical protein
MQTPIKTAYKTFLLAVVTTLLGALSSGAMAQQTVTFVSGSIYAYFNGSTTTNYDLTTTVYTGSNEAAITTNNPWWNSESTANLFATAVEFRSGNNFGAGPIFQYASNNDGSNNGSIWIGPAIEVPSSLSDPGAIFAVATTSSAGVPEIDGALAPKVGFLLACLFLIFGRKKENTEPMLTV